MWLKKMEQMLHRLIGAKVVLATVRRANPACVRIDPGQIEQVVVNLAVNARDAMPEGGTVTIEVGQQDFAGALAATIEVRDEGTGMTEDVLAHLYEPFFTTKARGGGTGLGLSIVYGIIRQAGGTIDVDTQLGRGTTFRVVLPEVANGDLQPAPRDASKLVIRGSETVMLVEDEEALRGLAVQVLRANGYAVLEASTGEEAERVSGDFKGAIHILVTDVVMPGMNGPALAGRLRSSRPLIRVLYISGYTENVLEVQGKLGSVTAFLQKPFAPSVLVHRVRELLDVRT